MNTIEQIQAWYASQCNGEWEHQYGMSIDTLDNPGWAVSIDLIDTNLENATMIPYQRDASDNDWVFCEIKDGKFIGNGSPDKLSIILEIFTSLFSEKQCPASG